MALANVNITDTFDVWRVRTNQIIVQLDQNDRSVNAAFNTVNSYSALISSSYDKANSANYFAYLVNANTVAAFNAANTALSGGGANTAYDQANTAYDQANAAFAAANVAIANVNYVNVYAQFANTVAIAAFTKANSGGGGGSYYIGNNGRVGDAANGKNDIFRVNNNFISSNLYFSDGENGSATGPLTVNTGCLIQINTGARVVII